MLADVVPERPVKGPPCSVCQALRDLPESEADALQALLRDRRVMYTTISEALFEHHGLIIAHGTVGKHCRGQCKALVKLRPKQ